jgi:hypothetical protein
MGATAPTPPELGCPGHSDSCFEIPKGERSAKKRTFLEYNLGLSFLSYSKAPSTQSPNRAFEPYEN